MDEISMEIEKLLDAVHRSDEYQEYQKQAAQLEADPELKARVMRFRGDNFRHTSRQRIRDIRFLMAPLCEGICRRRRLRGDEWHESEQRPWTV